jgi:RIO-like serine/threonine protein kinase
MRDKMTILEKLDSKFPSPYDPSQDVLIYKNPSGLEMQSIKSKTTFNELRGLVHVNAIYIWDANLAIHKDVANFLNITPTANFIITDENECISADDKILDLNLPMLKRMLK